MRKMCIQIGWIGPHSVLTRKIRVNGNPYSRIFYAVSMLARQWTSSTIYGAIARTTPESIRIVFHVCKGICIKHLDNFYHSHCTKNEVFH